MNRRLFIAQIVAGALAPKALMASDGVALKSIAHPVYTGIDVGVQGSFVVGRYVHRTYGLAFAIDSLGDRVEIPPGTKEAMRKHLEWCMEETYQSMRHMIDSTEYALRPESVEEMEIDIGKEPGGRIKLR